MFDEPGRTRCPILMAILFGSCFVLASCSGAGDPSPEYNVVLITMDTTRQDHLGCYGAAGNITPNLDALAAAGTRFDHAISTSGSTPTAHASILTGLNPAEHGVRVIFAGGGYELPESVPTFGTILNDQGWRTGAFLSSFTVSEFYGFDRGFETFDTGLRATADQSLNEAPDGFWDWGWQRNQRRADETTQQACRWIEQTNGPFFTWVHYWDPHDDALTPPREFCRRFITSDMDRDARKLALYRAEVAYMDSQIGRLIDCLKERDLYENTIIIAVADHGQGLGDHDWWFHRIIYQEQIKVPLIVRVPGWPTGGAVDDLVRATDILPTVLEHLDIALPENLAGRSLAGLVHGETESPRIAYADQLNLFDLNARIVRSRPDDGLLYCAMDRNWKLIHRPHVEGKDELYDLVNDPGEVRNLIGSELEHAARLMGELEGFGGFVTQPFGEAMNPEVLERLRSLGYVGD